MPKLTNSLPKYRKHKASGQAVTTIGGKDFYLGPHGTLASKREYDRLIAEYLASGRSPVFGKPAEVLTITQIAVAFMKHAKDYYGTSPTSEIHRFRPILKAVRKLYGKSAAEQFGPTEFKAVRQHFIDTGNSRTYINANMKKLVRVFKWAAAEGKLPASIPQTLALIPGLRKGKCEARETDPVEPVADEAVEATLPHLTSVVADMVRLQQLTGMRPAEICDMRPCDIVRTKTVWEFRPRAHKNSHRGKDRVVFIGPRGQEILVRYLVRDADSFCFCPADSEEKRRAEQHANRKTPLTCGNKPGSHRQRKPKRSPGPQYTTGTYGNAIRRACMKAFPFPKLGNRKVKELSEAEQEEWRLWRAAHTWSPNQLRHSAGTRIRHQHGLEAAQVLLGHARADVTQVYAERDFSKAAEVARQIG